MDRTLPPDSLPLRLEQLVRNYITKLCLEESSAWVLPTHHQANSFPFQFRSDKMYVIHEGIDTQLASPKPDISFKVRGQTVDRSTPVLTFVNRNLERLRGFDFFMRAIPHLQNAYPTLRIMIVGDNEKGYGKLHPSGRPLREVMLHELSGQLDLSRIHFFGRIPHDQLIALFQVSTVHVYLSYPFVLGSVYLRLCPVVVL